MKTFATVALILAFVGVVCGWLSMCITAFTTSGIDGLWWCAAATVMGFVVWPAGCNMIDTLRLIRKVR